MNGGLRELCSSRVPRSQWGFPRRSRRPERARAQSHIQAVVGFPRRRGSLATPCKEAQQTRSSSHFTTPKRDERARVVDLLLPSEMHSGCEATGKKEKAVSGTLCPSAYGRGNHSPPSPPTGDAVGVSCLSLRPIQPLGSPFALCSCAPWAFVQPHWGTMLGLPQGQRTLDLGNK